MQNNKTVEMTIYNKKGDVVGKQVYAVTDVNNGDDVTTATLNSEMFDKKGRSIVKGNSSIQCRNGMMMINMKMMMPQQQAAQMGSVDAKADEVYMEYPPDMKEGDDLKDGKFQMDIDNNGLKQSMNMNITARKVEGKETITTSAGSWDCYRISYKGKIHFKIMGIGKNMDLDGVEWFAPDFGIVKTSSQHGSTAITAIR